MQHAQRTVWALAVSPMTLHPEDLTQSGDVRRVTMRHIRELECALALLQERVVELEAEHEKLSDRIEALEREREDSKDG